MKTKSANASNSKPLPIIKRGNRFILQKTFDGKQRQHPLGTDKGNAITLCNRFLETVETDGYQKAVEELTGKSVLKNGDDPTIEQIEKLYRDFCDQSADPPEPETIKHNIARLKCIMTRAGVSTVGQIKKNELFQNWFKGAVATTAEKRTFRSAVLAASSVFKLSALEFYSSKGNTLENPFKGLELIAPKVSQFVPPSSDVLENIFETVETELKPHDAMIVLLAFCGLRRSEIEGITLKNFSVQSDKVLLNIEETGLFKPKAGQSGFVPITLETYNQLIRLRGKTDSKFFVPSESTKEGKGRLWERVKHVNKWLQGKGLTDKPLHNCRKITGSIIAKNQGVLEAAKVLRNTPQVCMVNYLGVSTVSTVDIKGSLVKKDPLEDTAKLAGITVEELKKKLGI